MALIHTQVSSKAIERIGYNPLTQELFILFNKNGKYPEYVWGGVPEALAEAFLLAGSKGGFYHANIKGKASFTVGKPLGMYRLGSIGRRISNVFRIGRRSP